MLDDVVRCNFKIIYRFLLQVISELSDLFFWSVCFKIGNRGLFLGPYWKMSKHKKFRLLMTTCLLQSHGVWGSRGRNGRFDQNGRSWNTRGSSDCESCDCRLRRGRPRIVVLPDFSGSVSIVSHAPISIGVLCSPAIALCPFGLCVRLSEPKGQR